MTEPVDIQAARKAALREALERIGNEATNVTQAITIAHKALAATPAVPEWVRGLVTVLEQIAPENPDDGNGWCVTCGGNLTYQNKGPYHEPNCRRSAIRGALATVPAWAKETK